ncbi:MAG: cobalamin B12-binding domain-containing protein [Gammaproteobacteria bacterium]
MEKHIRVLLTKPTHDCHDRGVRYLARRLRDDGFEVIFTNFLLVEEVVNTAVQEDVAVIGVSVSSGGHMAVFEDLMNGLRGAEVGDVLVIGGGVIPNADARELEQWGVRKVFGPGSSAESLMTFIRENRKP